MRIKYVERKGENRWQKRQRKYDTEYKIQVVKLAKELDSTKAVAELGILEN